MKVPLEISFRDIEPDDEIKEFINRKIQKLERFCDHINSVRCAIERPQKHQESGSPYRVRLDITVAPRHEIVARREPGQGDMHEPLNAVITDTVNAARRQLKELVERQHKEVKEHPTHEVHAFVDNLFPEQDYGFLKNLKGEQVYFHKNSLVNEEFSNLEEGTGVWYKGEMGDKGLQASTVRVIEKPTM